MSIDSDRVIGELRELRKLTADEHGAQRVCWTPTWRTARTWLAEKLAALPVEVTTDAAGNLWATLAGASSREVVVGSHLDSVYNGGWLDGALGVVAGLEVLRSYADAGRTPPLTLTLVDWADEEGVRFGRSLLGSSAVAGTLERSELDGLVDRGGTTIADGLRECGVDIDRVTSAHGRLDPVVASVELHVEQGKLLEQAGLGIGVSPGTCGAHRHAITFSGISDIGCGTPMAGRKDAFVAAARFALEVREIARAHDGVTTVGSCELSPGTSTAIAGRARLLMEQNHFDGAALTRMVDEAKDAARRIASEDATGVTYDPLWSIDPIPFDEGISALADGVVEGLQGRSLRVPSAPLHDVAELQRAGVPSALLFVRSIGGISHHPDEDSSVEDLRLGIAALGETVERVMRWAGGDA